MDASGRTPRYFISAGETSGDLLGSELMAALKQEMPDFEGHGIFGPSMREECPQGALFPSEDLAVMGFFEVLRHLPRLKEFESLLLAKIERLRPKFAILIDYPGFHLRLAEQLRWRQIPVIQYVAPQLWAWGKERVHHLRQVTDLVLGIMPFEAEFFRQNHVNYQYVGTPQLDRSLRAEADRPGFGLAEELRTYGFFPGSRASEVSRLAPECSKIAASLKDVEPRCQIVMSMAPGLPKELYEHCLGQSRSMVKLIRGRSLALMKSVDAALVASGTATLECALAGTPLAVMYKLTPMSYFLAKRLVTLDNISLVNLVAERPLVREFVQFFSANEIAAELRRLAVSDDVELLQLRERLKANPGLYAAQTIRTWWVQMSKGRLN